MTLAVKVALNRNTINQSISADFRLSTSLENKSEAQQDRAE